MTGDGLLAFVLCSLPYVLRPGEISKRIPSLKMSYQEAKCLLVTMQLCVVFIHSATNPVRG